MKRIIWIVLLSGILIVGFSPACKKQQEALPDLVVKSISCMGGSLYITVENQGEGNLPEDWFSVASLYLDGVVQEDIILNKPTSTAKGGINKPNGLSNYLIPYNISSSVSVDLYLDYNDDIKESNEDNNKIEGYYIGPCSLPDLRIEDIYLDEDSKVVVSIENIGAANFPLDAWITYQDPDCILRIFVNEEEQCKKSLFEFDPDKQLEPSTGRVVFPSDLKITEESTVTAIIDCSDIIKEQNKENNTKTVTLK